MPPKKRARPGPPAVEFVLARKSNVAAPAAPTLAELREEFEHKAGVRLPDALVSLMEHSGGGDTVWLVRCYARVAGQPGKFVHVTGIAGLRNKESSLWCSDELCEEWQLPDARLGKLLLLSGDGHEWLTLCYKKDGVEPSVVALSEGEGGGGGGGGDDDDDGDNDDEGAQYKAIEVAATVADFIQSLEFHDDGDSIVLALSPAAAAATPPAQQQMSFEAVRSELNRLLHIDIPSLPADPPTPKAVAAKDISLNGHAVGQLKLWQDPEMLAGPADVWFVTLFCPSESDCTAAADAFIRLVGSSFFAQVVSQPISSDNIVCTLEA